MSQLTPFGSNLNVVTAIAGLVNAPRPVRPLDKPERFADYFDRVLQPELALRFPHVAPPLSWAIGALAHLGPDRPGFVPDTLVKEFFGLVRAYKAVAPQSTGRAAGSYRPHVAELAAAYAAGWHREAKGGSARWDAPWPLAIQEIVNLTRSFVPNVFKTLSWQVRDFQRENLGGKKGFPSGVAATDIGGDDGSGDDGPDDLLDKKNAQRASHESEYASAMTEDAQAIAGEFIGLSRPSGTAEYQKFQLLRNWDPRRGNLYAYIRYQLRGDWESQGRLVANRFRNTLLYPRLLTRGWIAVGKIAFQECDACGRKVVFCRDVIPLPRGLKCSFRVKSRHSRGILAQLYTHAVAASDHKWKGDRDSLQLSTTLTVPDGVMTVGSANLDSVTAKWQGSDVNQSISVAGAGADGAPLCGTIAKRTSATRVALSVTASTSVSGATVTVVRTAERPFREEYTDDRCDCGHAVKITFQDLIHRPGVYVGTPFKACRRQSGLYYGVSFAMCPFHPGEPRTTEGTILLVREVLRPDPFVTKRAFEPPNDYEESEPDDGGLTGGDGRDKD